MDTRDLPMFPLGTVLFPFAPLPLHVFEPRYRAMVRDLLAGDGEFGVVLIERGHEVGGGDVRFDHGAVARLMQCRELSDGGYSLAAFGVARLQVLEWLPDDPYPRARVRILELADSSDDVGRLLGETERRLLDLYGAFAQLDPRVSVPESFELHPDPEVAAYELCARAPLGSFDALRLLRCDTAAERLVRLLEMLEEQQLMLRARLEDR